MVVIIYQPPGYERKSSLSWLIELELWYIEFFPSWITAPRRYQQEKC